MIRPHARVLGALVLAAAAVSPVIAQQAPAQPPAQADPSRPASTDAEFRKQLRDTFQRRLENRKREIEKLEQALKLLDEGKTIEEVRQLIPDLPRFGRGEGREAMQNRMERFARGESAWGSSGDVNQLGPGGGGGPGPRGADSAGGPGRQPEPPRPLTAEDREAIRSVLESTSPALLEKLRELEKKEPAEAERKYTEAYPRLRWLVELRKRDAVAYDLKLKDIKHGREAYEHAREIVKLDATPNSSAADRQQHESAMRTALLAQYNVRTESMRHEADRLKDRSGDMLKQIEKRDAEAGTVIEKNMKDMLERERRHADGRKGEHREERHEQPPRS